MEIIGKITGTHWIKLYVNGDNVTYFYSFWVEYIPKEIKELIENKNFIRNSYRILENDSIMYWYFCTVLNDFMLKGKRLLDYTNLFSPSKYEKNDKMTPKYF